MGLPDKPECGAWHWLLPRNTRIPLPVWWDHVGQTWQDHSQNYTPEQVVHKFEYVEPITWAIVHEPEINRSTIV